MVTKQQLATQGKRTTKFDYVPARINTVSGSSVLLLFSFTTQ